MKKRILSMILALVMVLSMFPVTAFAAEQTATDAASLAAAFAAAVDGDEIKINTAGTYALSTSGKNITITGTVDGVVFDNIGAKNMGGANVTFNNVTFDYYPNTNYTGLQHAGAMVYNNCTFNGQPFLYGTSETFNNCTFNQTSSDAYNVWTYGAKEVNFNGCTFNSAGKSVLVYNEGKDYFGEVNVVSCEFKASAAVAGKAAIEIDTSLNKNAGAGAVVNIDADTTATGFGTGNVSGNSLWNDKKDRDNGTVKVDGTKVWPVEAPAVPTATVTKIENDDLTFALNFKADEATEEQLAYYGNWYADYELTVNKTVTFNADGYADGWLSGQYDTWNERWVNVPFEDVTLSAGGSIKIMATAAELMGQSGLRFTYADVYNLVKDFDCGVFFDEEFLDANPDLQVTLQLKMYNRVNPDKVHVIGTYTFPETKYTVNMNGNGGVLSSGYEVYQIKNLSEYGTVDLKNPGYTYFGYDLSGWKTGKGVFFPVGENSVAELVAADKNQTDTTIYITAQWTPKQYYINFNGSGGTHNGKNEVFITSVANYTVGYEDIITFEDVLADNGKTFSKLGYELVGWSIGAGNNENVYELNQEVTVAELLTYDSKPNDETIRVTAVWAPKDYKLHFDGGKYGKNDGLKVLEVDVNAEDKVVLGDIDGNYIREGYTLVGWKATSTDNKYDLTSEYVVLDLLKNDYRPNDSIIYLSAMWDANEYTITFDTDGGTAIAPITQDYGTAVTAPDDPTKKGYTFAGWDPALPETMPLNGLEVKAKWTPNTYIVAFDGNGATSGEMDEQSFTYDEVQSLTANAFTKTGHTFKGWALDAEGEVAYADCAKASNLTNVQNGEVTLYAVWTANQYTITFDTDGGTAIDPITQDYGTDVTAPAAPTKTGYTFAGWDVEIPATMPAENVTIKALWTINQYTITFANTGDTEIAPITQDYGTDVTAPAAPTKTGYTFAGWDTEIPETMPAENVTITAKWTANTYTIIFKENGATSGKMDPQVFIYDVAQKLNTNQFVRNGYKFLGWNTAYNGGGADFADEAMILNLTAEANGVITLYAQYEKKTPSGPSYVAVNRDPFIDVDKKDWFFDEVMYVYENGIMNGVSSNEFDPYGKVNRAMVVTTLWRMQGSPEVLNAPTFTDVADGQWYAKAVAWAAANGIVNGMGDGTFAPLDAVTREQVAAMLNRYADYKGWKVEAKDTEAYIHSAWSEENVDWADTVGLFDDLGVNVTDLTKSANRAELAAYLTRFMENVAK